MHIHTYLSRYVVGLALILGTGALAGQNREQPNRWVATWGTAPVAEPIPSQPTGDRTYREIVHVSQGAQEVRAIFSNEFGTTPLNITSAHIALSAEQSRIDTGTDRALTFSGRDEVVVPPGARMVSDPITLNVPALSSLAISFYIPSQEIPVLSIHHLGIQTNYVVAGNAVAEEELPSAKQIETYPILRAVEIHPSDPSYTIACLGDSITDGLHSTIGINGRWPNILADRLVDSEGHRAPTVVNLGIGGNRLLQTGKGPAALARLDRDILSQPNLAYLIVLEGINDIGEGWGPKSQEPNPPSAKDIIAAYQQIITRAHEHNIIVYGGTLLPYQSAHDYYSPAGEAIREEVNAWIRGSGAFDAVLDFDKALADPEDPHRMLRAYASPDGLHPNDIGYKAMGDNIPLRLFPETR